MVCVFFAGVRQPKQTTPKMLNGKFEEETAEDGEYVKIVCDQGFINPEPYLRCIGERLDPSKDITPFNCLKGSILIVLIHI